VASFKAIVIEKADGGQKVGLVDFDERNLMEGDVTVRVERSTVNYKDGLAITGKAPVVRRFPMIAGIDFAGTVEASTHPEWKAGDRVILNGWGCGETHLGGYAEKARVKGGWLVPLPDGMIARDAMAIGTAGYTAMLAVMALERQDVTPTGGPVIVTGAAGGVGSVAVAILAKRGFQVTASTGRPEEAAYLEKTRSERDRRAQGTHRTRKTIGKRALGGRHRHGRLDHARQCACDDSLSRRGGGVWTRWRHGFAEFRRTVYSARCVAHRHRFRDVSDYRATRGVEAVGGRPRSGKACGHDERNRARRGDRGGPQHRRRPGSGSNRGEHRVNAFTIWRPCAGMMVPDSHG